MKQTVVTDTEMVVAEGSAKNKDGEPVELRVLILEHRQTGEQFHFPMPVPQADALGEMLQGKEPSLNPDIMVPQRPPSPQELEQLQKAAQGNVVGGS